MDMDYVIKTGCGEIIGLGGTIEEAIKSALSECTPDDFIDWCCYGEEITESIEQFSMHELYDMAKAIAG